MERFVFPLQLAVLVALAGAPVAAQTTPSTAPPVDALVAEALAKSPALAAARSRSVAAREMERPAAALPDPMIEGMIQNADFPSYTIGSEDMSMAGVEVRQPLPYPGKLRARAEAARAETSVRQAEIAELERRVTLEVRSLYGRIYGVDRERQSLAAARELVDLMTATASARYSSGQSEQEALLKSQLQVTRLEERLDDLDAERRTLVAELNRWLDRPGEAPLGEVAALPEVQPLAGALAERAAEAAPRVAVARAAIEAAERRLATARLDLKPDLSPLAGLAYRGSKGPVLTLRLGVELPFRKRERQEPMIRAAEAEVEAARQELRDAQAMARAEATRIASDWTKAERQILRYREGIVPQTSATFDAARSSYLAGRGDFSTVIEDFNLWLESRVQLARREADRYAAWAALESLTGELP
ncbi:MAG: TolC family protein [Thermoanaerobaculia bacterium]